MMTPTTERLLALWRKMDDLGELPPTIREAQLALGLSSPSVVVFHLVKLCQDGLMVHQPNHAHAYRLAKGL